MPIQSAVIGDVFTTAAKDAVQSLKLRVVITPTVNGVEVGVPSVAHSTAERSEVFQSAAPKEAPSQMSISQKPVEKAASTEKPSFERAPDSNPGPKEPEKPKEAFHKSATLYESAAPVPAGENSADLIGSQLAQRRETYKK